MSAPRLAAAPIAPVTLVDRVHERIWDWITAGKLSPGDWLRIQELARSLHVSDTPIREALIRLQQSGLVEAIPHVGTRIKQFTRQDIEEVFDLREALECYALQRIGGALPDATLRRLKRQLQQARLALDRGSVELAVTTDMELHTEIVGGVGNSRISALFTNLRDQVHTFARFGNRTPDGPRRFLEIHVRIVDLLLDRNILGAIRLMRRHMQLAKQNAVRGYFGPGDVSRKPHHSPESRRKCGTDSHLRKPVETGR